LSSFKQHDKKKVWKQGYTDLVDEKGKPLAVTKKAKANGQRLHQWTLKSVWEKMAFYRCLVCDFYDTACWPHTPDPREPYCPATPTRVSEAKQDVKGPRYALSLSISTANQVIATADHNA
jgi:hypothetical protein